MEARRRHGLDEEVGGGGSIVGFGRMVVDFDAAFDEHAPQGAGLPSQNLCGLFKRVAVGLAGDPQGGSLKEVFFQAELPNGPEGGAFVDAARGQALAFQVDDLAVDDAVQEVGGGPGDAYA